LKYLGKGSKQPFLTTDNDVTVAIKALRNTFPVFFVTEEEHGIAPPMTSF